MYNTCIHTPTTSTFIFAQIEVISKKTSVLFVCIMSHGVQGHVHGTEGDYGSINTVMYDMRCEIPKYIPMVSHGVT